MPQKTLRFKIHQDGRVEETVEGFTGNSCNEATKNLEDETIDELIQQVPYYGHLRVIPKEDSKNNSPVIYAKDLLELLLFVFNELDMKLYYRDIFPIIKIAMLKPN